jgi:tetratricopeptide (TPR) repeat protein
MSKAGADHGVAEPAQPVTSPSDVRQELVARLLDAALQAERVGNFLELVQQRPLATRWLVRRHQRLIRGTAGDAMPADGLALTAGWLLRWLLAQLRPDAEPHLRNIPDAAWLHLHAWRPALAAAAVAGFVAVPDFPRQYRRRSGEPALENLCGLWGVGQSTVYRMIERARRQMAQILMDPAPNAKRRLTLREAVFGELRRLGHVADESGSPAWHAQQADLAQRNGDAASALWHLWRALDWVRFARILYGRASELAVEPETDALVARALAHALPPRVEVDLWLAQASLARIRGSTEGELRAIERARQVAHAAQEPLLQGIAQGALGKFYESRDTERAVACYQDSAEFLRHYGPEQGDDDALAHVITTYVRLAWMYLLRNDERSRGLLERAEELRTRARVPDSLLGMLEQVWAEYWRRLGDHVRSLEHRYRALTIFERVGERRSILTTYLNLTVNYNTSGDPARAIRYAELVLQEARQGGVAPETVVNAHLAIGTANFLMGRLDQSITAHQEALRLCAQADLRLQRFRANYNLAEAFYTRFRDRHDPADERAGDGYVQAALASPKSDSGTVSRDAARNLKTEVLGAAPQPPRAGDADELLPAEVVVHAAEWAEVQRLRQVLSIPSGPEAHAQAHLAIARAYTAIAAKEREAALALIDKHGLRAQFVAAIDELRQTYERELTREQQLAAAWKQQASDLCDDTRRAALITRLLRDGAVNKSAYGELCGVAPATASKHLGLLTERGLLVQLGKGPATRYALPSAPG